MHRAERPFEEYMVVSVAALSEKARTNLRQSPSLGTIRCLQHQWRRSGAKHRPVNGKASPSCSRRLPEVAEPAARRPEAPRRSRANTRASRPILEFIRVQAAIVCNLLTLQAPCCSDLARRQFDAVDSHFQTRSASVTPQAWASQPRCVWGASPSRISGIWPKQPSHKSRSKLAR